MSERVIPGVSIREITEGLTGIPAVGAVAVKLVGTACKGSDEPRFYGPGELPNLVKEYGPVDPYHYSTSTGTNPPQELSLVRAAKILAKADPPGGVWVCRAVSSAVKAVGEAAIGSTDLILQFTAQEYGSWFNNFNFKHESAKDAQGETVADVSTLWLQIPSIDLFDSENHATDFGSRNKFYQDNLGTPFEYLAQTAGSSATIGDLISQWTSPLNSLNQYFAAASVGTGTGELITDTSSYTSVFTSGDTGGTNWSADDQAMPVIAAYNAALTKIRSKDARLLVIAGASEDTTRFSGVIGAGQVHVNNASREKHEQVYVCGVENEANQTTMVAAISTDSVLNLVDARVVKVAPGFKDSNPFAGAVGTWTIPTVNTDTEITLSGGYAAALVAGVIAQNVPDDSPMNKPMIGINGLEHVFTLSNQKILVRDDFFLLVESNGNRTLRDLTTAGEGDAFFHVSTRMVVDDIKYAVRLAGQPFIGKKNIARILATLQRNLEFVLSEYERREIITSGWSINIQSSRTQQIIGVVQVTMIIMPVFYIEFIEVELVLE